MNNSIIKGIFKCPECEEIFENPRGHWCPGCRCVELRESEEENE